MDASALADLNTSFSITSCASSDTTAAVENMQVNRDEKFVLPADFDEDRSLYRPHGKWAWADGLEILSTDSGSRLGYGLEGTVDLKLGQIKGKEVVYVSKLFSVWDQWRLLFSSLYLNASSKYLRPLQGICVPWIIGVFHCNGGRIGIAQDLPHPTGWREADMYLEDHQKEAIIAAYQKLHDRGVLHGDAEYRHWLIGDDGEVTIIDFGFARVIRPDEGAQKANVELCTRRTLNDEMRKVKFLLNYKDSREKEFKLAKVRKAREDLDRARRGKARIVNNRISVANLPPPLCITEEEIAAGTPALHLSDLNDWMYGERWTAHRFEVIRTKGRVEIRKTAVVRPPILQVPVVTSSSPLTLSPIASTSAGSAAPSDSQNSPHITQVNATSPRHHEQIGSIDRHSSKRDEHKVANGVVQEKNKVDASLKRPRDQEDTDDSDSEMTSDSDSGEPTSNGEAVKDKGKGKCHKTEEREKKRQRRSATPMLRAKPKPKLGVSRPLPIVRSHSVYNFEQSPQASTSRAAMGDRGSVNPDIYPGWKGPMSDEPSPADRTDTLQAWSLFHKTREELQRLQGEMDKLVAKSEQYRHDLLRTLLKVSAAQRKSLLSTIKQPDSLSILELFPNRPSQPPSPDSTEVLQRRRVQLIQSIAHSRVTRRPGRPRVEYPRVAEIKRAARTSCTPKIPSKLGSGGTKKLGDPRGSNTPTYSSDSQSDDGPEPLMKVKAALKHMEQYKQAVMRRAQLEEGQEKAGSSSTPRQSRQQMRPQREQGKEHRQSSTTPALNTARPNTEKIPLSPTSTPSHVPDMDDESCAGDEVAIHNIECPLVAEACRLSNVPYIYPRSLEPLDPQENAEPGSSTNGTINPIGENDQQRNSMVLEREAEDRASVSVNGKRKQEEPEDNVEPEAKKRKVT